MADVAPHGKLVPTLAALLVVAGACSGDDDGAGTSTAAVSTTVSAPPHSPVTAANPSVDPSAAPTDPPASTEPAPPPTAGPSDTGVPGLDSEDAFCSAWSRFGGSWQLLLQAGAATDAAQVARLEVIASTVVQGAYDDVLAVWPAELESERDVVADAYFGAFQRRSADAAAALAAAGANGADVAALAEAWNGALAQYDPSSTVDVVVPPALEPIVDQAADAFSAARVPLPSDPSMVITAETPLTDAFLATACPDQGWIVGQDVVDDGA